MSTPRQSPLFHAEQADRYSRQDLIIEYQNSFECRLVVLIDLIFPQSMSLFEELIYDASPDQDLHLLLATPGGDGETAVRLIRSAQARCRELTIMVPDQAKSAGTIMCLGAHHIGMGPTSDLGPVDPQFQMPNGNLVSAKSIIAAVKSAEEAVQNHPESFPIHASLLSGVDALLLEAAKAAMSRGAELVQDALRSNPARSADEAVAIADKLKQQLIDTPSSHAAIFGADDADAIGLPVLKLDPQSPQWRLIWRLWAKYLVTGERWYEGERCSKSLGQRPF